MMLAAVLLLAAPPVDYARDVLPILSNQCFKCHGPGTQKAGLRLDTKAFAVKADAVVPGKPAASGIIERVCAADDDGRMPPPDTAAKLTPAQIETLKTWIEQGAEYAPHWSFLPPVKAAPPGGAAGNPIDAFVLQRLAKEGLAPSPPADRATLARRVFLDLIGLLPQPAELDAFLNDAAPDAYEKLVDRLLASPHYGERQARHWLDLARYADSNGYTVDGARQIWPWRDWVVAAFNADMPFDRFTVEQLAGDLLPTPTKAQLIATGFHRNTAFNEEGGSDPEQFRVERTLDRTNTTAAVWLGLTLGCCQCHDHKYDPLPQADYFRFYAFFNSVDEPTLPVGGTPELEKKVNDLTAKANALKAAGKLDEGKAVEKEIKKLSGSIPTTLVLKERAKPRPSFVHVRGDFLRVGATVTPGTPGVLPPLAKPTGSRLDLAGWLTAPENPLTARVVVNRAWQQFFGRGLVETENDFGIQGRLPTHPELLDWLAVSFREDGWSVKALHRRIVLSATYRQASQLRIADCGLRIEEPVAAFAGAAGSLLANPQSAIRNPQLKDVNNLLLARQNRTRVEAEIIRDAALSASGKLARKLGGPGVYPPQAAEVFSFTQSKHAWPESKGDDRYRRGLYTFVWRQSQHPLVTTFDGADAQTACTKRNRSNTPLQALHLANDPVFVELAAALGARIVKDGPPDDAGRAAYAFKLCLARTPTDAERDRIVKYASAQSGPPEKAWAAVGRVLMNLDEFVTRE